MLVHHQDAKIYVLTIYYVHNKKYTFMMTMLDLIVPAATETHLTFEFLQNSDSHQIPLLDLYFFPLIIFIKGVILLCHVYCDLK